MAHRVAVAISGGRDSSALLHATARACAPLGITLQAFHVHHGLMPQADAWQAQVAAWCEACGVPLQVRRLQGRPQAAESVEAWARRERYLALAEMARQSGIGLVLLAHHRRDQAETFVLQALRGAGTAGLAAMPASVLRDGITWARPWLQQPREAIEAYVAAHGIQPVEDDSNTDTRFARNRLRLEVMPALNAAFAGAESALAASARRLAEADAALSEWAGEAVAACSLGDALVRERWQPLSPARRATVLRYWLAQRLGQGAPQRLMDRLLAEWPAAVAASWPAAAGQVLRHYRGCLRMEPAAAVDSGLAAAAPLPLCIAAPGLIALPDWGGALRVEASEVGVPLAWLSSCDLRRRQGGEQFQQAAGRPARSLKKAFQAQAVSAWARAAPLLWARGQLVFVPGLGLDARCLQAEAPGPRVALHWLPMPAGNRALVDGR